MQRLPESTDAPSFEMLLHEQKGVLAFDVGANIGQAARILAPHFERVISFEPCAESNTILITEAPFNVHVEPLAVSNHTGQCELDETENSIKWGQLTTGNRLGWGNIIGRRTVPCVTLDQYRMNTRCPAPDLVKVDVEGHEVKVVQGAVYLISLKRAVWLIEIHDREFLEPILKCFKDGYKTRVIPHDWLLGSEQRFDHFYMEATPCE